VDISSGRYGDVFVVAPAGRVDHTNAERLQATIAPLLEQLGSAAHGLVLDFRSVEYISSVGLRVLMMASKHARACQAHIAVAALQPVVAEIFGISRFNQVLDVFPSVGDALARISPSAAAAFETAQRGRSG
jgi:anti-anti-sigma factor